MNIVKELDPRKMTFAARRRSLGKLEPRATEIGGIGKTGSQPVVNRRYLPKSRLAHSQSGVWWEWHCRLGVRGGFGVQVCARQHQRRQTDFRRDRRLGRYDPLVAWTKPPRSVWMDEATYAYAAIPAELTATRL